MSRSMKRKIHFLIAIIIFFVGTNVPVYAEEISSAKVCAAVDAFENATEKPTVQTTERATSQTTVLPTQNSTAYPTANPTMNPTDSHENPPVVNTMPPDGATSDVTGEPGAVGNPTTTPTTPAATATAPPIPTTKGNSLTKAKKNAKRQLRSYLDLSNYNEKEKELIKSLLRAAEKDINKLTSVKEVKAYVKIAKKVFDDIPTSAELLGMDKVKVKFIKNNVKVKVGEKALLKVKLMPKKLGKKANKVKWSINKKGRKVVKFVKKTKKLNGKLKVNIKALKKGEAKITCETPNGRTAVCTIIVK